MEVPQQFGLSLCLDFGDCSGAGCQDIAETPSEDCWSACDAALALCGDDGSSEFRGPTACAWACEAFDAALPISDLSRVTACIESYDTCPDLFGEGGVDEDTPSWGGVLAYCLYANDDCEALCEQLAPCSDDADYDVEACVFECGYMFGAYPEFLAGIADCVDSVQGTGVGACVQRFECLPPGEDQLRDWACDATCARFEEGGDCSGVPFGGDCAITCQNALEIGGPPQVANAMCARYAACDEAAACFDSEIAVDESCRTACDGADVCGDWEVFFLDAPDTSMCHYACSGVAASAAGFDAAGCVAAMGSTCDVSLASCTD